MSILIRNGTILTMENGQIIRNGAVYVEDDRIVAVGGSDTLAKDHRADEIVEAENRLVLPGFVNAHDHTDGDRLLRGYGIDVNVALEYFKQFKWPMLARMRDEDFYAGALVGYIEQIKSGVTTIADNYYSIRGLSIEGVARAAEESGIRSILVRGYQDYPYLLPEEFVESTSELRRTYEAFFRKWHNACDGRIKVWVGPVNLLYCTTDSIVELNDLAAKFGAGLHSHVAEEPRGVALIKERFGKGYIDVLSELGVLGPRFQAAHGTWVSDREIKLLSEAKATVVHNPVGNMLLCMGIAPVRKMMDAGVRVALGGDTKSDIISAMKFASCLQKVSTMQPTSLTANQTIRMATLSGAEAYGLGKETGSLKPGKKADITIVDLRKPHLMPVKEPEIGLVYFANSADVETVIINGKIVMKERKVLTVDENRAIALAQSAAQRVTSTLREV